MFTFHAGKVRELRDLVNELNTVTQWYLLGIYLGLHPSALDAIKKNCTDTKECCTHMLIEWQRLVIPTWSAVVKALMGIGRDRLASHLAAKYGMLSLYFDLTNSCCCITDNNINLVLQEFPFQTQLIITLWKNWKSLK